VFGVIQRKITKGQKVPLAGPLTGMLEMLPYKQRRQLERELTREVGKDADVGQLGRVSVGYPAAVLTTIAVYR
jgi:hypothetical protein